MQTLERWCLGLHRERLGSEPEDRRGGAARQHPVLARQGLLQLCVQRLDPAGETLRWCAGHDNTSILSKPIEPGFTSHAPFPPAPFRLHRQVPNSQNALARHRLCGPRQSCPRRGQTLHSALELHQGRKIEATKS